MSDDEALRKGRQITSQYQAYMKGSFNMGGRSCTVLAIKRREGGLPAQASSPTSAKKPGGLPDAEVVPDFS